MILVGFVLEEGLLGWSSVEVALMCASRSSRRLVRERRLGVLIGVASSSGGLMERWRKRVLAWIILMRWDTGRISEASRNIVRL